jgi:hypothetical protein
MILISKIAFGFIYIAINEKSFFAFKNSQLITIDRRTLPQFKSDIVIK